MAPHLLPWCLLQFLLLLGVSSAQTQLNITLGSSLTPQGPNTSWLSPSGDFAFGFWQLGGSSSYLLAVWFNKIPEKTVAWYAKSSSDGQEAPVEVTSSSVLQLTTGGLLSLRDSSGTELWSPRAPSVDHARMLDSGDFTLVGADGKVKWETFGVPADTILPRQVLSVGQEDKVIRSRLLDTDYSDGRFLLAVQTDGNLVMYPMVDNSTSRYKAYWASNTVGNGSQLVFNETGRVYFTLKNGAENTITSADGYPTDDFFLRATLDPDGVFRQYVYPKSTKVISQLNFQWRAVSSVSLNICQRVSGDVGSGACGFNSYCTFDGTNNQTSCQCPQGYGFFDKVRQYKGCRPDFVPQSCDFDEAAATAQFEMIPIDHVDWPYSDYEQYSPINETECGRRCVVDCFCAIAIFDATSQGTCWKKRLPLSNGYMADSVQRTALIKVPRNNNSEYQLGIGSSKWKKDKKYWILGSSLFLGSSVLVNILLISILLFGTYCSFSIIKIQSSKSSGTSILAPKIFTYNELEKATGGFCEVLGSGASSTVYKGQLQDEHATSVAVKKLQKLQQETEKEFMVEVQTIGQTFHKNLVRLLGFCNEGTDRLLVYEFMPNGSLNEFIFGDAKPHWSLRVQVALGVARGLLYLHEECSTQIIHCDIKPQNILLDDNFIAKIADFGLAKLLRANQTQTNTGIRGTRGYVAPEWFKNIGITSKVDVYSFGVILLELVCCRRNVELEIADDERTILTYWANDCYRCGRIDLLVDGDDEANLNIKMAERFVAVALWCLQEEPTMRPTMLKVTQMLDGAVQIPMLPDQSSFISSLQ